MRDLQIPDELWNAHGGSKEKMKTILWMAAMEQGTLKEKENVSVTLRGTHFTAKYRTTCPVCGNRVEPDTEAVMVDWEDGSRAIHADCAARS